MKLEAKPFKVERETMPLLRQDELGIDFPVAAMGELAKTVIAVAKIAQAPVEIAAQSVLAVAALCAQTEVDVETLQGTSCPTSLFFLTIAASGERKSTCDRLITQGVTRREVEKERAFKSDLDWYEFEYKLYQDAYKKAKSHDQRPEKPKRPIEPMRLVGDPTLEGLIKAFITGQPSVLLLSDEGDTILGGYTMNKDNRLKTLSGFSKLWDGTPVNRTRGGDGARTLRGRRLSMHLMVQPLVAEPLLADRIATDQGFLSRTLICQPSSLIGTRFFQQASAECYEQVQIFANQVFERSNWQPRDGYEDRLVLEPRTLRLAPLGKEVIRKFYDKIEGLQATGQRYSEIKGFASKIVETALRLAGVLTYWRDPAAKQLDLKVIEDSIKLSEFYLEEARRLTNIASVSQHTREAQQLLEWLQNSWKDIHLLPQDVLQKGPNRLRERVKIAPLLATLVEAGHLVRLEKGVIIREKPRKEAYLVVKN